MLGPYKILPDFLVCKIWLKRAELQENPFPPSPCISWLSVSHC